MIKVAPSRTVREILVNISWVSLERLIRLGGGLLVGTLVARYLGPASFGIFSYAYAIYALFNILSNLGLDLLIVKDITLEPKSEDEILGTAFLLKVGASFITTAAAILFAALLKPNDWITIKITALLSLASVFQGFEVVGFFFQAKLKSRVTIIPTALVFIAMCGARVIAVFTHGTLLAISWIAAIEITLTQLCLGVCYVWQSRRLPKWHFNRTKAASLLRESWPLMLSSFLIVVYVRCDQIILGMFCKPATVGDYSAAVKLAELWYSLPLIVCGSVMPQLLRIKESNWIEYHARLQRLYDLLALSSVAVAILTMLVGKTAISIVFGSQYMAAYPILSIYIWTGLFVFLGIVGAQQMTYDGLGTVQLQRSVFGAIANILLNFLLVPTFGAIGSAISTLIVQAIVSYGLDLLNPKTRQIFRIKTRAYLFLWIFDRNLWKQGLSTSLLG